MHSQSERKAADKAFNLPQCLVAPMLRIIHCADAGIDAVVTAIYNEFRSHMVVGEQVNYRPTYSSKPYDCYRSENIRHLFLQYYIQTAGHRHVGHTGGARQQA